MKIHYSFSLTPPAPSPAPAPEKLVEHAYNEFQLSLPEHWRQIPSAEDNTFNWRSEPENATIIVSADFYEIPDDKAQALAERNLSSREDALRQSTAKAVTVLQRSIKPHSGGIGLELSLVAEVEGECLYLYLGYVTSRKIFNFALVSQGDRPHAITLFNRLMSSIRIELP